jgi:hypothetical protein
MPSPFVKPTTVRLRLSEDRWIEAKERLNFGELQALNSAGLTRVGGVFPNGSGAAADDVGLDVDMARWMVERIAVWLVDWSFRDDDDRPVRVSRDAIRSLDPAVAQEIQDALDAHVAAQEALGKATSTRPPTGTRSR